MIYAGIKRGYVMPEDYVSELLAYQCMPTLLKLKPASLITVDKGLVPDVREIYSLIRSYLDQYSCSFMTFQETESRLYLFLYSEYLLSQAITAGNRQSFLESLEYPVGKEQMDLTLSQLGKRFRNYWITGGFPHEIGIFLGYPLADVEGFILHGGRNYILCGMWKVYQRVKVAEAAFYNFRRIKTRAVELANRNGELLRLCKEEQQLYQSIVWDLLSY